MPQFGHRKKPFSAKQKKIQLQQKRDRSRDGGPEEGCSSGRGHRGRGCGARRGRVKHENMGHADSSSGDEAGQKQVGLKMINQQPGQKGTKAYDPNRYRLHFLRDTKADIEKRKQAAAEPYDILSEEALEMDHEDVYQPGSVLDMPKRPPWNYKLSKHQLLSQEEKYFRKYLENIIEKYSSEELSYFELNLETWRQLWRVLEMADIILLITDIRHPALHFSPALHSYVTKDLGKPLLLVLNKIDLVPPSLVVAWKDYFQQKFPDIHIVCFTSFPKDQAESQQIHNDPGKVFHKKRQKKSFSAVGPRELLKACQNIVQGKVDLNDWQVKIEHDMSETEAETSAATPLHEEDFDEGPYTQSERYKDGILTIGCCGYPNVGKSSLMNGLVGKKVVSVSRTPGHTKHFQTIFLTHTVKLCDSPGLVFPSLIPKPMQILAGIYPIAQVREPYSAVGYLSSRIPVPSLLKLRHPDYEGMAHEQGGQETLEWSAINVCEAWAKKRGFVTAKAARLDVYRAANNLLRITMEGRLIMCTRPPGFTKQKEHWESHTETSEIRQLQELHRHQREERGELEPDLLDSDKDVDEAEDDDEEDTDEDSEEKDNHREEKNVSVSNPFALLADDD